MKPISDKKKLEQAIRAELEKTDLTLTKIQEETGISKSHIHDIKTGARPASLEKLMDLARYFGIRYRFEG